MFDLFNNEIIGYLWIAIDITEQKKADKALKESEERYRTIIDAFPDIILISDLRPNYPFMSGIPVEDHIFA